MQIRKVTWVQHVSKKDFRLQDPDLQVRFLDEFHAIRLVGAHHKQHVTFAIVQTPCEGIQPNSIRFYYDAEITKTTVPKDEPKLHAETLPQRKHCPILDPPPPNPAPLLKPTPSLPPNQAPVPRTAGVHSTTSKSTPKWHQAHLALKLGALARRHLRERFVAATASAVQLQKPLISIQSMDAGPRSCYRYRLPVMTALQQIHVQKVTSQGLHRLWSEAAGTLACCGVPLRMQFVA